MTGVDPVDEAGAAAEIAALVRDGSAALGLPAAPERNARIVEYLALLAKWRRRINLTAVVDRRQAVCKHILDSLVAVPYLRGRAVIDIGTGAGLPGIPLAIACPEVHFQLLDSRRRRIQFLIQVSARLGLETVEVVHGRVEQYRPKTNFDTLTARAFGRLPDLVARSGHLCRPGGRILAWKGVRPTDELEGLPRGFTVAAVHRLHVPGLDAERHLVVVERAPAN